MDNPYEPTIAEQVPGNQSVAVRILEYMAYTLFVLGMFCVSLAGLLFRPSYWMFLAGVLGTYSFGYQAWLLVKMAITGEAHDD